jgi:5-methylcytosine-specific restriction protein A
MKLGNFLAADPSYHGKGLQRGGKLEKQIWDEFHSDPLELHRLANAIKAGYQSAAARPAAADEPDEDDFPEGKLIYRMHRTRERNPALVRLVKTRALKASGRLACAVCRFDFARTYGSPGEGYIECHHTLPLSAAAGRTRTRAEDIALLCSNCHRMVHRRRPWLGIEELSTLVEKASG